MVFVLVDNFLSELNALGEAFNELPLFDGAQKIQMSMATEAYLLCRPRVSPPIPIPPNSRRRWRGGITL